ncbi:hypothetical protein ACBI99_26080 [Nonomuraea sp. ATR24]|uniref:hypothetical protein n=1 Tax=Nonomuraea sp. ATR24 TaxID=1676744 RepID=UPI0035BEDFD9
MAEAGFLEVGVELGIDAGDVAHDQGREEAALVRREDVGGIAEALAEDSRCRLEVGRGREDAGRGADQESRGGQGRGGGLDEAAGDLDALAGEQVAPLRAVGEDRDGGVDGEVVAWGADGIEGGFGYHAVAAEVARLGASDLGVVREGDLGGHLGVLAGKGCHRACGDGVEAQGDRGCGGGDADEDGDHHVAACGGGDEGACR